MATTTLSSLSESKKASVRKALGTGKTQAQVAEQFGLSIAQVRRINGYVEPAKRNGSVNDRAVFGKGQRPAAAVKAPVKAAGTKSSPGFRRKVILAAKPPKAKVDNSIGIADIAVVKAVDLHRWLSDVQPFAGHDDTLPMLTGTHIEWDGKRFLAATTDRFTLGISKLDVPEEPPQDVTTLALLDENVDFMLAPNDVASILRIAKTARKDSDWRMVTISRVGTVLAGVTVPVFTYRFKFFSGETLEVKPFDVEFPKIKQLLPTGEPVARALTCVNADYLVKFAKVAGDHTGRIKLYSFDDSEEGGAKPTVAMIGTDFVGMIMPVRCPDDAKWVKPGWVK